MATSEPVEVRVAAEQAEARLIDRLATSLGAVEFASATTKEIRMTHLDPTDREDAPR
ncbi:MAG: hypothetical protein H0T99_09615 [Geodermatophilaceae bacterium]|nr:hypothetical protein [Geodermatophilaceae bacterium]